MIYSAVKKLVTYGIEKELVPVEEKIYTTNLILDVLCLVDFEDDGVEYSDVDLESTLKELMLSFDKEATAEILCYVLIGVMVLVLVALLLRAAFGLIKVRDENM